MCCLACVVGMPRVKRLHHFCARTTARTCLVPGELSVGARLAGLESERVKGTDCSVTGEPGERPPSVQ